MLSGERMVCGKGEEHYYKGESWGEVEGEVDMKKCNGTCVGNIIMKPITARTVGVGTHQVDSRHPPVSFSPALGSQALATIPSLFT